MRAPVRSVLVTGASSGIGLAIAQLLSRSGIQVFAGTRKFSDRPNSEKCAALREIILDVTKADSIATARREIEERLNGGGLFAVVNNAASAMSLRWNLYRWKNSSKSLM